jgi:hypothetical protein
MRVFHMNLNEYNANTQCVPGLGGVLAPTAKHTALRLQMSNYLGTLGGGATCDVAAFTEVLVADGHTAANVIAALNDFGAALNIPVGAGRKLAVIRCGRTALQNSNEVVALVVNGNAVIHNYGLRYFTAFPIVWQDQAIAAAGAGNFTTYLNLPNNNPPVDYRYIVYVDYTLGGSRRQIGFIHNRAPGNDQTMVVMQGIRNLAEQNGLTLIGGDFNATASPEPWVNASGQRVGNNHTQYYYSAGLTTVANRYDYWISGVQLMAPGGLVTAAAERTAHPPSAVAGGGYTGSDHCGTGLNIA